MQSCFNAFRRSVTNMLVVNLCVATIFSYEINLSDMRLYAYINSTLLYFINLLFPRSCVRFNSQKESLIKKTNKLLIYCDSRRYCNIVIIYKLHRIEYVHIILSFLNKHDVCRLFRTMWCVDHYRFLVIIMIILS